MPVSRRTAAEVEKQRQASVQATPSPYWVSDCGRAVVYVGDCREVMARMESEQFHAVVTDPPYGLEFMGKDWDAPWKDGGGSTDARQRRAAELSNPVKAQYLRHGVTYGGVGKRSRGHIGVTDEGTDVSHPFRDGTARTRYGLSDPQGYQAWFQTRAEQILRVAKPGAHLLSFGGTRMWHRMVCAIEDAGFDIRDTIMWVYGSGFPKGCNVSAQIDKLLDTNGTPVGVRREPTTPEAKQWSGWNVALKPAYEPITLARKPLPGTVAQCVLEHGTGALNIDRCRVPVNGCRQSLTGGMGRKSAPVYGYFARTQVDTIETTQGRWPANLIHDGSDEVVELFPKQAGGGADSNLTYTTDPGGIGKVLGGKERSGAMVQTYDDSGSAARFFYTAKADDSDRPHGKGATSHPTVKPLDLMRYLVRLVCSPDGTVLDPFMGSGSTGCAALEEGMRFVGIEQSKEYADLAVGRLKLALTTRGGERSTPPPPGKLRGAT